jgi:hypothetical protein
MSLHRDLRRRVFDAAEIALGEFDGGRPDVLLQAMQLRGAWNWDNLGLLSEDPRQRDLGGRCLLPLSNLADQVDQGLVRFAGLWVEARDGVPEVAAGECGVLVDLAREEAFAHRAEGNEADSELLERPFSPVS